MNPFLPLFLPLFLPSPTDRQIKSKAARWRWNQCGLWLAGLAIGWLSWGVPIASAQIIRTAEVTGAVVVQSRHTLRDRQQQSWQVIAFQRIQPAQTEPIQLRLIGFPGGAQVQHPQPIALLYADQAWQLADVSAAIGTEDLLNLGQYDLAPALPQLPQQWLRLELALQTSEPIVLKIAPAIVQEWQQIASITAADIRQTCEKFPLEARHNPDFPQWTSCQLPVAKN